MGQKPVFSAIGRDGDATASAVEMHGLRDAPLNPPTRRRRAKTPRAWRFLHPVAWLLLLCIGGPILLHELAIHYLEGSVQMNGIQTSLPCDAQGVWTSWSTLFEVNIRTANLSFTNAKIIDVTFDIVVGRGGQACLAWIAYRVYTDVLTRITEKGQIGYDLVAAIALRPNDVRTLGTAVTSVPSTKTLWTKFTLIWTILAMSYVLAYPTIVSAATSPVGATTTAIQLPNSGTAPIEAYVASAAYSLAETGLENKPNPWIIPVADINLVGEHMCNVMYLGNHQWGGIDGNAIVVNHTTYALSNNTRTTCGFDYANTFYPTEMNVLSPSMDRSYRDQITCVPDGHNYQWGASWELLVVLLILQIIWSFGMLFMWIEATRHSQLVQRGRKMGMWRAILDLAEPLLLRVGPGTGMYSETELADSVRHLPPVHYMAKVENSRDEGYSQDVHLVSGPDGWEGEQYDRSSRLSDSRLQHPLH